MYAIIEDSGTQIKVSTGDVIRIDPRELADDAATVTFDKVMLVSPDEGEAAVGQPYIAGATVTADIVDDQVSEKTRLVKSRRRKGYKRMKGHRQPYLAVKVTSIHA